MLMTKDSFTRIPYIHIYLTSVKTETIIENQRKVSGTKTTPSHFHLKKAFYLTRANEPMTSFHNFSCKHLVKNKNKYSKLKYKNP